MSLPEKLHKNYSFLVDVNLPKRFSFFNAGKFSHVADLNPRMTDEDIWNYAIQNDKVIITKDVDFYDKYMSSDKFPKIIYLKLGNLKLSEMHLYFESNWEFIIERLREANFIIAEKERIKIII